MNETMYKIYDGSYNEVDEPLNGFSSIAAAASFVLTVLPDDFVYMIGTDAGIEAMVFQGQVYYPQRIDGS